MYNHKEIEKKWQDFWEKNKTFKTDNISEKPKFYVLDMFPYPSGAGLHVGHPEGYTANDIVARYKNALGYNVLHPMGWDAFGLPAENYAIKTGTHPKITTQNNIETFKRQIKALGFSYDWDREIDTTDPKYYKWTQWIFLKMFEAGLAYEQDLPINYCPSCKTGLANEEVLSDNTCDRCGNSVEKKKIRQWVLAITKYADRLEKDVDKLDWPKGIKDMQKNWIGRSEGCEFEMKKWYPPIPNPFPPREKGESENLQKKSFSLGGKDLDRGISVYTTRIDTVFSMAFVVIAPDHAKVMDFITEEQKESCLDYINKSKNESEQERTNEGKEKTGVFTGSYVINPYNNEKVPLWIGDFVLGHYGTGAVFGDIHDERDYIFAQKYGIPLKQSIAPVFEGWSNGEGKPKKDVETIISKGIGAVLLNQKGDKVLILNWNHSGKWKSFVTGRTEEGENIFESAIRELKEETGYVNFKYLGKELIRKTNNYHPGKNINYSSLAHGYLFQLESDEQIEVSEEELSKHTFEWIDIKDVKNVLSFDDHKILVEHFFEGKVITGDGILVNSGEFDGLTSSEARKVLTEYAEKNGFGEKRVNYKLRDWLFSRQRYWGEPIPLIHLEKDDFENLEMIENLEQVKENNKAYVLAKNPPIPNPFPPREKGDSSFMENTPDYITNLSQELRKKQTNTENVMWEILRRKQINGIKFRRQHPFGRYIADFYSDEIKLVIEIDGEIHENEKQKEYDKIRDEVISKYGVKILRIKNSEIENDLEQVIEKIVSYCSTPFSLGGKGWDRGISLDKYLVIGGKVVSKIYDGIYTKIICDYKLPLELPEVEKYEPAGDGQSPLANVENFVNIKLADNLTGKRETNTMPQWGGSCWYYLRFMDNQNSIEIVNSEVEKYWGQVDSYVGGAEHAVLHLLYARFWHKFLFDIGVVSNDEPFYRLRNQGLILAYAYQRANGGLVANDEVEEVNGKYFEKATKEELKQIVSKMSKSLKNVVNPDEIINEYGADALRLYEMYMSDFKDSAPWDTKNIVGVSRFLDKVWNIFEEKRISKENDNFTMKLLNKTIKKVGEDIEEYKFNTAIAQMMILVNNGLPKDEKLQAEWKEKLLIILNPFAPHITEELWKKLGNDNSIFLSNWPKYDENLVKDDVIIIGVQVLGKLRGEIEIGVDEEQNSVLAKANENVAKWIEGKEILKEIYVKGKIVNLVVK